MPASAATRRRFITDFSSVGLSSTLLPGVLWAKLHEERSERISAAMLRDALAVAGLDFTEDERRQLLSGANQNLTRYADLRQIHIDPNIAPPLYYTPPPQPPSAIREHFQVANLCGYPAVSVPNGFTADGKPTSITFLGRLYAEAEILALARAYQERAGFHLKHPRLA